jgi:O-methyltransferase involved in polyketide biosynthesis
VGLDLGAGLDTRVVRIAAPATVDWYDVDYPAVVATRERVIPDRVNAHNIGDDVTDLDWLNTVPSDRPAVIVADGLMGFLTKEDFMSLLNRLI